MALIKIKKTFLDILVPVDGCVEADGTCLLRCFPVAEDGFAECENDYADGLLDDVEFVKCIKTVEYEFSHCWDVCTCEMPWCNCVPPSFPFSSPYEVHCYPDPE